MKISMKDYYLFGKEKFGPFLFEFISWLKNEINIKGITRVFFFSRDGYMMKKVWDEINDNEDIFSEYVYFSRKSIRQALLWKFNNYEDSLIYLSEESYISLKQLLSYYNLEEDEVKGYLNEKNILFSKEYKFSELAYVDELKALYNSFKDVINKKSEDQYNLILGYLEQINMIDKCAIVDIGWHGSMQYYIEKIFEESGKKIDFEAFYIGISPRFQLQHNYYGFLYNEENDKNRKKILCFLGILEKLFQGFEGSVTKYTHTSDYRVIPQTAEYEYCNKPQLIKKLKTIHQGAFDYIKRRGSNLLIKDFDRTKKLIKFGMRPTLKEVYLFKDFYCEDGDWYYFIKNKPLYKYKLQDIKSELSNSSWKVGYMKSILKLPFPYYEIYKIFRR